MAFETRESLKLVKAFQRKVDNEVSVCARALAAEQADLRQAVHEQQSVQAELSRPSVIAWDEPAADVLMASEINWRNQLSGKLKLQAQLVDEATQRVAHATQALAIARRRLKMAGELVDSTAFQVLIGEESRAEVVLNELYGLRAARARRASKLAKSGTSVRPDLAVEGKLHPNP